MSIVNPMIRIGDRIAKSFQNGIYKHADEYSDDGIGIVRINDYDNDGIKKFECLKRVRLSSNEIDRFSLKHNDILINRVNSLSHIGKSCIVEGLDDTTVFESNMMRLRLTRNSGISPEYFLMVLTSARARNYFRKVAKLAVAQASINQEDVMSLAVFLPNIQQQTAIASLISIWDLAIEKNERLIATKERQFSWLTIELLSCRKRIDGFSDKWKILSFSEIFTQHKVVNRENADLEVLSVTKDGIIRQSEYFNKEVASDNKSNYLIAERGALVMSGLNFWMGSIDFQHICDIGIVSPAYKVFRINSSDVSADFVKFFVRSQFMTTILIRSSIQGASIVRRNLDMDELNESPIHIPSIEEQKAISDILISAEREISLLKQQLSTFKRQKRGLMQKLLNGEWRVKLNQGGENETSTN